MFCSGSVLILSISGERPTAGREISIFSYAHTPLPVPGHSPVIAFSDLFLLCIDVDGNRGCDQDTLHDDLPVAVDTHQDHTVVDDTDDDRTDDDIEHIAKAAGEAGAADNRCRDRVSVKPPRA